MTTRDRTVDLIMQVMNAAFDPTFGEAWNTRQVADALTLSNTHALVIDAAGNPLGEAGNDDSPDPAGFVLSRSAADEEELLLIAIIPEARRRGLGKLLIGKMFESARTRGTRRVFLEMRRGNPAERLYEGAGFVVIGSRANYYRLADGGSADAITFGREI